MRDISDVRCA